MNGPFDLNPAICFLDCC